MARKTSSPSRTPADVPSGLDLRTLLAEEFSPGPLAIEYSLVEAVDFSGRQSSSFKLKNCAVENVSLSNCTILSSFFQDVRFRKCNLSNAVLRGNRATRIELVECRLTGLKAIECNWRDVLIEGCDARYAQFNEGSVRISEFRASQFQDTDFRKTDLGETIFAQAALHRADLTGAKLRNTDLRGAELSDVTLHAEDLRGAVVSPAQAMELARLLGVIIK